MRTLFCPSDNIPSPIDLLTMSALSEAMLILLVVSSLNPASEAVRTPLTEAVSVISCRLSAFWKEALLAVIPYQSFHRCLFDSANGYSQLPCCFVQDVAKVIGY